MIFEKTKLADVTIIHPEKLEDERGFFARVWCGKEFIQHGLSDKLVQCNISHNARRGTLRGMHYQKKPYQEVKLVRCTAGSIFDVIIDLRPNSQTFKQWIGVELTAKNCTMLYVPKGFAHGYLTLSDNAEVAYQVSEYYTSSAEDGVRWNDTVFQIVWPITDGLIMSSKDQSWPDFVSL